MNAQKPKIYFFISTICVVVASIMISLIQFASVDGTKTQKIFSLVIAIVFWLSFACSQLFFWLIDFNRKKVGFGNGYKIGLISFFQNKEAKIADLSMIIFAFLVIILLFFRVDSGFIVTVSVALLFLSFIMHCYLNGKNYRYIYSL